MRLDPDAKTRTRARVRVAHLRRVVVDRWGAAGLPPNTDPAMIAALADHLVAAGIEPGTRLLRLAELWDADPESVAAEAHREDGDIWTADRLAEIVALTPEDRERLRCWSIRPEGWTSADLAANRRWKDRQRKAEKRRAEGRPTAAERAAGSVAAIAKAEGVSRMTICRRVTREGVASSECVTLGSAVNKYDISADATVTPSDDPAGIASAPAPSARRLAGGDR